MDSSLLAAIVLAFFSAFISVVSMVFQIKQSHIQALSSRYMKHSNLKSIALVVCGLFLAGCVFFIRWLNNQATSNRDAELNALAEYSENALRAGDYSSALEYALRASKISDYNPPSVSSATVLRVLSDVLGVYNLKDGYKPYYTLKLDSDKIVKVSLSPNGKMFAILTDEKLCVYSLESGSVIFTKLADSTIKGFDFDTGNRIVCATEDGILLNDFDDAGLSWSNEIHESDNLSIARFARIGAAISNSSSEVIVFSLDNGTVLYTVPLPVGTGLYLNEANDYTKCLFDMADNGHWLATSFADSSLWILNLTDKKWNQVLTNDIGLSISQTVTSGFADKWFALASSDSNNPFFCVINSETSEVTISANSLENYCLFASDSCIYFSLDNRVAKFNTNDMNFVESVIDYVDSPVTFIKVSSDRILVLSADGSFCVIDDASKTKLDVPEFERRFDSVDICDDYMVLCNFDDMQITVLKWVSFKDVSFMSYDPGYSHTEARVSEDLSTAILYSVNGFKVFEGGHAVADVRFPDSNKVYDIYFKRSDKNALLEVVYNDGFTRKYDVKSGVLVSEEQGPVLSNKSLYRECTTEDYLIKPSPSGKVEIISNKSGELIKTIQDGDYLTYANQIDEYLIIEWISVNGKRYGTLLNQDCDIIATLPNLCDILPGPLLVFDDYAGHLSRSGVFSPEELVDIAESYQRQRFTQAPLD